MNYTKIINQHIRNQRAYSFTNIVNFAKRERVEILVDYHYLFYEIEKLVLRKLEKDYENEFIFLPLGENDYMGKAFIDFHNAFKEVGIDLVWIDSNPKFNIERENRRIINLTNENYERKNIIKRRLFNVCEENQRFREYFYWTANYTENYCLNQLKNIAEVIEMQYEIQNKYLIQIYKERKSFAIFTNNPSLAFIKDCNILIFWMLTFHYGEDILNLPFIDKTVGNIIKVPEELRFPIINHLELMRTLKLKDYDQLLCVSVLSGNYITQYYVEDIAHLTNIPFSDDVKYLTEVVNYVKNRNITTTNILRIPQLQEYMNEHTNLEKEIQNYVSMYNEASTSNFRALNISDNLTSFLQSGIVIGNISRFCGTIHMGYNTTSMLLENLPEEWDRIVDTLIDIRKLTYPYLVNKRINEVYEYKWRSMEYEAIHVDHAEIQADQIVGIPEGLNIFETIWSHNESASLNYVERFGMKKALVLYMLRYFYIITKDKNLCLSLQDFKSMFVTVFYHYCRWNKITLNISFEREIFLRMNICPRVTCLNMITWFMKIYFTAKYICGGAFGITDYFPEPGDLINGSVFLAFYEAINDYMNRGNNIFFNTREDLRNVSEEIMTMFDDEFTKVTEN